MIVANREYVVQILEQHIPVEIDECACGVLLGSENMAHAWAEHVAEEML